MTWETWLDKKTRPRPSRARIIVRNVAREKELAAYMHLSCGHWTTREEQEFRSVWKPRKGVWYCPECEEWLILWKPPEKKPLTEVPPF